MPEKKSTHTCHLNSHIILISLAFKVLETWIIQQEGNVILQLFSSRQTITISIHQVKPSWSCLNYQSCWQRSMLDAQHFLNGLLWNQQLSRQIAMNLNPNPSIDLTKLCFLKAILPVCGSLKNTDPHYFLISIRHDWKIKYNRRTILAITESSGCIYMQRKILRYFKLIKLTELLSCTLMLHDS